MGFDLIILREVIILLTNAEFLKDMDLNQTIILNLKEKIHPILIKIFNQMVYLYNLM
jgi:hypothetical protein